MGIQGHKSSNFAPMKAGALVLLFVVFAPAKVLAATGRGDDACQKVADETFVDALFVAESEIKNAAASTVTIPTCGISNIEAGLEEIVILNVGQSKCSVFAKEEILRKIVKAEMAGVHCNCKVGPLFGVKLLSFLSTPKDCTASYCLRMHTESANLKKMADGRKLSKAAIRGFETTHKRKFNNGDNWRFTPYTDNATSVEEAGTELQPLAKTFADALSVAESGIESVVTPTVTKYSCGISNTKAGLEEIVIDHDENVMKCNIFQRNADLRKVVKPEAANRNCNCKVGPLFGVTLLSFMSLKEDCTVLECLRMHTESANMEKMAKAGKLTPADISEFQRSHKANFNEEDNWKYKLYTDNAPSGAILQPLAKTFLDTLSVAELKETPVGSADAYQPRGEMKQALEARETPVGVAGEDLRVRYRSDYTMHLDPIIDQMEAELKSVKMPDALQKDMKLLREMPDLTLEAMPPLDKTRTDLKLLEAIPEAKPTLDKMEIDLQVMKEIEFATPLAKTKMELDVLEKMPELTTPEALELLREKIKSLEIIKESHVQKIKAEYDAKIAGKH